MIDGLVKATIDEDLVDEETVGKHPHAFEALKSAVPDVSLERLTAQTGSSRGSFPRNCLHFCRIAEIDHLCAKGIVRRTNGYQNVLKLMDLAWITGKLGRTGCGVST